MAFKRTIYVFAATFAVGILVMKQFNLIASNPTSLNTDVASIVTTSLVRRRADASASRIAYVSQGPAKSYPVLKKQFDTLMLEVPDTASFFFHSYDEDCDGCIFQPKTTPEMGRNIALKAATQSPFWNNFKYIVMFDDDITLMHMKTVKGVYKLDPAKKDKASHQTNGVEKSHPELIEQSWKALHKLLLDELTYPLWKPRDIYFDYWKNKVHGPSYQSCVDDNFWAIRRDHIDFLYPFSTLYTHENFWLNALATFMKMEKCFPAGWWVDNRLTGLYPEWSHGNQDSVP
jgi:hypothetical protein